eukprot:CAMPEP_0181027378 /NCGR_PEP_ID=MMETSP1070-20121207/4134_1 /TAXON_ID=265543 /ORGANISM="Minutocellus polymorphus, Strain NH13" /LENGTH=411 /DNA_ID=CAMNT_0023104619 /DNA_START=77 /DNA_END=1312 /DNA_ORIENTATION=+
MNQQDDGDDDRKPSSSNVPSSDGPSSPPASSSAAAGSEGGDNNVTTTNSTIESDIDTIYIDYSELTPSDMVDDDGAPNGSGPGKKEPTFIAKLHSILSNPAFEDIVSWLPHGRAWRVHQRRAFEEQVIPLYFRHGKYSSFMRQVNGWGFQRIYQGPDYNGYYHELFLRGMPHLANKMRRPSGINKAKVAPSLSSAGRKVSTSNAGTICTAPDFYRMAETHPLPLPTILVPQPTPILQATTPSHGGLGQELGANLSANISDSVAVPIDNAAGAAYSLHATAGILGPAINNHFPAVAGAYGANLLAPQPSLRSLLWANPAAASYQPPLTLPQNQMLMETLLAQQYQISHQQHILSSLGAPLAMAGSGLNAAAMLSLGTGPTVLELQGEASTAQYEAQPQLPNTFEESAAKEEK